MVEQMRHVFDQQNKFFKHLRTLKRSKENAVGTGTESQHDTTASGRVVDMNEEERAWRLSLDVGKTIDVFKQDAKKGHEMWTKGEIVAVTG